MSTLTSFAVTAFSVSAFAVTAFAALYTEMSDHPDTTSLDTEFAEKVLANPVIQTLRDAGCPWVHSS